MKTNSLLAKVRRLTEQAKPEAAQVDIAAILNEGRAQMLKGERPPIEPLTPELMEKMKSTHTGRVLLAARLRVGWYS